MSKLTRREPFRELVSMRKEMDLLFDEVFSHPARAMAYSSRIPYQNHSLQIALPAGSAAANG